MGTRNNSVVVDLDGLAKLWAKQKTRVLFELLANAHDPKGTTAIEVYIDKVNPDGLDRDYRILVSDNNPTGFKDLSHAWTMFADSEKKDDPSSLGMFNLGEKLVIAVSKQVTIISINGGVMFDASGRHTLRKTTGEKGGTTVEVIMSMTKDEVAEMVNLMYMFIPRPSVDVYLNGTSILHRTPIKQFEMVLPIPIAESLAADMRLSNRLCTVSIFEPKADETPMLYGLGIPIVPNDSKWHYHVGQKVPVPFDRDNVRPSYMKALHVECVNQMHQLLTAEDTTKTFVKVAVEDDKITQEAFSGVRIKKHGDKVVIHDPKYPEATKIAVSGGYIPLFGRSESDGFFRNNRRFGDVKTAQEVTPQAVPFGDGPPLKLLDPNKMTDGMRLYGEFANFVFRNIVNPHGSLSITWANDSSWPFNMTFGKIRSGGSLTVNVGKLGYEWFDRKPADTEAIIDLTIHEFGHYFSLDHLSKEYYTALTMLGAKLALLALQQPKLFRRFRQTKPVPEMV